MSVDYDPIDRILARQEEGESVGCTPIVWPATCLGDASPKDFEKFMEEQFGVDVVFCCEAETNVVLDDGSHRHDLLFLMNNEDVPKFAVARLTTDIKWWSDWVDQGHYGDYDRTVLEKYGFDQ